MPIDNQHPGETIKDDSGSELDAFEEFCSSSANTLVETLNEEIRASPAYTEGATVKSQPQPPLTFLRVRVAGSWSTSTGTDGQPLGTLHPATRHVIAEGLAEMTEDANSEIASQLPNATPQETALLVKKTLSRMVDIMGFEGNVSVTPTTGSREDNTRLTTLQRESACLSRVVGSWGKGKHTIVLVTQP
ncbi:hypothetical protein IAR50_005770 [Cryptococcus sp. DSM 104548]